MARLHPDVGAFANAEPAVNDFLDEFQRESDRAAAVLGPAVLDDRLRQLIERTMVPGSARTKLLGVMQPLGPFGPRIYAAEALGLISADEAADLHRTREIRNAFAHQLNGLSFDDTGISQRCGHFRCVNAALASSAGFAQTFSLSATSRNRFNLAVALLAMFLSRRLNAATPFQAAQSPL